jgi:ABC-type multidrug transport system ATPase subunit
VHFFVLRQGRDNIHIENAFAYIDQLDKHAPRLSVAETFEFAGQCKSGGKLLQSSDFEDSEEGQAAYKKIVESDIELELVLSMLGLTDVKDTFVGDTEIRGVSGGQRRRVTVGEMLMHRSPVLCGDEISTGLDAASTYDMVQVMLHFGKMQRMTRIFALLQPSPDTVSLFDEVILLTEGRIIFAGPIEEVEDYFALIGYKSPPFMDVADFLQMVSTEDGATLYDPAPEIKKIRPDAPTLSQLADLYQDSIFAKQIQSDLKSENTYVWSPTDPGSQKKSVSEVAELDEVKNKYANSYFRSSGLIMHRFLTLWVRDKRVIIAGVFKNALMGVSVGGVYFNIQDPISIQGALFQTGLFIMLGTFPFAVFGSIVKCLLGF